MVNKTKGVIMSELNELVVGLLCFFFDNVGNST
jgi:hypothetical protein